METEPIQEEVTSGGIAETGYGLETKGKPSAVDQRGLSGKTTDAEVKATIKRKKKKKKVIRENEEFPGFKKLKLKEDVNVDLDMAGPSDFEEFPEDDESDEEDIDLEKPCGCNSPEPVAANAPTVSMPSDIVSLVADLTLSIKEIEEKVADMRYKLMLILSKK